MSIQEKRKQFDMATWHISRHTGNGFFLHAVRDETHHYGSLSSLMQGEGLNSHKKVSFY